MMLKKKIDPEEKNEKFLETTLKTHYPKVYADMIKNDYILTHSTKTQQHLDQLPDGDYANKRWANLQMQQQLPHITSGKQGKIPYQT